MLVFNHNEDGDFITREEILKDTGSKTRIITDNIPYLETIYSKKDILDVIIASERKGTIKFTEG
jgi:hypothetical protein